MPDRASTELGRAAACTAVVWDGVLAAVQSLEATHAAPLEVVDLGGGTGGLAVKVAELGHRVTVVDPSPDALASLRRRAVDAGVADLVHGVQGDAADLADHVGEHAAHLVLCHEVLEVLEDPAVGLAGTYRALVPGGVASVLVAGRLAAVLARALAGDFQRARSLLGSSAEGWDVRAEGPRRFTGEEITEAVVEHGFEVMRVDAVRAFSDLVPSALVDTETSARHELLELERAVAARPEFLAVASQIHVLAGR